MATDLEAYPITGLGMLTSVGKDVPSSFSALLQGISGCRGISRFPTEGFPVRIAAEVPQEFWGHARLGSLAYTFAEIAITEALTMAGLAGQPLGPKTALVVGVGGDDNGTDDELAFLDSLIEVAPHLPHSALGTIAMAHPAVRRTQLTLETLASELAIHFGIRGEVLTVSTACASGAHAIALAGDLLRDGAARRVVAVGTDAMVKRLTLANFCTLGVLSKRNAAPESACRPFDARRQGFVLGEGAGALVLESPDASPERHRVAGHLVSYGVSADAYSITDKESDGEGLRIAIEQALRTGGISPQQLAYINAHGTGTQQNDIGEAAALRRALGERARQIPISSIKGQIGHPIAAAGAIEAIVTLLAVTQSVAPGTSTLEVVAQEAADLNLPGPGAHPIPSGLGMSLSAGFGGVNVCLILRPPAAESGGPEKGIEEALT